MGNHSNIKNNNNSINLLGFGLLSFRRSNSDWNYNITFQKGIGKPLVQNVIELYKKEIIGNDKGNSVIPLDNGTVYLQYFRIEDNHIIVLIYMDKKNPYNSYSKLYLLTKQVKKFYESGVERSEIVEFCDDSIEIPVSEDLIGLFVIGSSGRPYFSQIDKHKTTIAKSEIHIGGFISALFSFSQEIIGQESGGNLKEINFGNQRFYLITRNGIIFAFLVEKMSDLLERYMYLIAEEFIDQFKEVLTNFDGDITKFKTFKETIKEYFII